MNCVKMGHALFPMLENEQNKRDNAFLVDKQNQLRDLKKGISISFSFLSIVVTWALSDDIQNDCT